LNEDPNALALAVDDAHLLPGQDIWNGGWIVVNAPACKPQEILHAIRSGNFYSSCGPEIHSITFDGGQLHLETSPVRFARIAGPAWNGRNDDWFSHRTPAQASQLSYTRTSSIPILSSKIINS
jgi:hypothetical protein